MLKRSLDEVVEGIIHHLRKKKRRAQTPLPQTIQELIQHAKEQADKLPNPPNVREIQKSAEAAHAAVTQLIREIKAAGLYEHLPGTQLERALTMIDVWRLNVRATRTRLQMRDWIFARCARDLIATCTEDPLAASGNVLAVARLIYEGAYGLPEKMPDHWLLKACQNVCNKEWIGPGIAFDTGRHWPGPPPGRFNR
jgi:hypothetical protein